MYYYSKRDGYRLYLETGAGSEHETAYRSAFRCPSLPQRAALLDAYATERNRNLGGT